jgi:hypothetical protein
MYASIPSTSDVGEYSAPYRAAAAGWPGERSAESALSLGTPTCPGALTFGRASTPSSGYVEVVEASHELVVSAWGRVAFDCGCPDLYYCPKSGDVECPRHSGFGTCCDDVEAHISVPIETRSASPRPPMPPALLSREYRAMIGERESDKWTQRATVWATSLKEARDKLEAEYGEGTVFLLRNEWHSKQPR